ncbi:F-box protein At4g00755-like isoform X2 [Primulina eburnea]|uniref:F-box protein At4g00755-like isoform X2 n=1 Tax=Primulina eburnea TaxID=1245227 RepID=UPI003C6C52CB
MDDGVDFIQRLEQDMCMKILGYLEDPSDLVRVCAVSSSWRQFVISNGLCKEVCLRMFPETSNFDHIVEIRNMFEPTETETDDSAEWACLEREHRAYASLSRCLTSSTRKNCILDAIYASSTDNYPEESIKNTLEPSDRVNQRASYWSSKGQIDPTVSEILIYELAATLCLITEFQVHPFQAYFHFGFPIYSSKAVRFHVGHPKVPLEFENDDRDHFLGVRDFSDDKFVWTHSSPEFPMAQENQLQTFKLPEPVFAVGGILKVELLGRVQTQELDGQYYICINNVQVVGIPLSPAFDVEMLDEHQKCTLKYYPESVDLLLPPKSLEPQSSTSPSRFHRFSTSLRTWEQMVLDTFRAAGPLIVDDDDSDYDYID